ncbi:hypothetical protein [Lyngbya sp. CCY1209]|uniref:F0F1 ATP synthase subunit B family protein n=1 Tax=Lyngbya sp. CCY1209 TaxID=2886103 RepID=UPI002D20901B|nr:hypothetical protein [Lyngbya sp. CCY1209]MEB3882642.1 hypothetical protein [Lyngbya sp. CCY1209]
MLIDWFTVVAQIVNFVILVFLLQKFLYKPIVGTIQKRQNRIQSRWDEAQQAREKAEREAETYRQRRRELDDRRSALRSEVKRETREQRETWLEEARRDVDRQQREWRQGLRRQQSLFFDTLRNQTVRHLYDMTRGALREIADTDLEKQAIAQFQRRLDGIGDEEKRQLRESLDRSDEAIAVRSSFEIPEDTKNSIFEQLRHLTGDRDLSLASEAEESAELNGNSPESPEEIEDKIPVFFERSPRLICGIEVQIAGYEIGWSLNHYIEGLEERLSECLQAEIEKRRSREDRPEEEAEERLQRRAIEKTRAIVRRTLRDLANEDLERQMIAVFLKSLQQIDPKRRQALDRALAETDEILTVRSSFEIPETEKEQIVHHLKFKGLINNKNRVKFHRSDHPICGIELQIGGHEIAWSIDRYLQNVEDKLSANLASNGHFPASG